MTVSWPVTISQAANAGAFLVASSCRARDSCAQPPARWSRPQKVRAACSVVRHGRQPGRAEGGHEPVDLVDLGVGQPKRSGHHPPGIAWASIASDARRYSPASQSLARCR